MINRVQEIPRGVNLSFSGSEEKNGCSRVPIEPLTKGSLVNIFLNSLFSQEAKLVKTCLNKVNDKGFRVIQLKEV